LGARSELGEWTEERGHSKVKNSLEAERHGRTGRAGQTVGEDGAWAQGTEEMRGRNHGAGTRADARQRESRGNHHE
jgi:hypothetical protein